MLIYNHIHISLVNPYVWCFSFPWFNPRAPLYVVQTDDWDCSCSILWDPIHADCAVPQVSWFSFMHFSSLNYLLQMCSWSLVNMAAYNAFLKKVIIPWLTNLMAFLQLVPHHNISFWRVGFFGRGILIFYLQIWYFAFNDILILPKKKCLLH